jgi:hypothetical protein
MLTKVVAGLLAVVAVGFAGTSVYQNSFTGQGGKCHHSACTGDGSYQPMTESSDSSCCQSPAEEGSCCSLRSRVLVDGIPDCCEQQTKNVASAKTADDEIDPWQ